MLFTLDKLQHILAQMPACEHVRVGFSGGLDSVVLLHSLVQLRSQHKLPFALSAIHVHHGLNKRASEWQQQCADQCQRWQVEFTSVAVTVDQAAADGLENAAREARYQVFADCLQPGDCLLLAHHRDDQMETLLLRLLRGSGSRGLRGIPRRRTLANGFLFRPLLDFDRSALLDYGQAAGLHWIDDGANADQQFDRNYCRHTLLPLIEARWPGYRDSFSKTATLAAESEALLQELAREDLQRLQQGKPNALDLDALQQLSPPRQRNLLRQWFQVLQLPAPGWNLLQQLSDELIAASRDSKGSINGAGFSISRYQNSLLVLQQLPAVDNTLVLQWQPLTQPLLELPANGSLRTRKVAAAAEQPRLLMTAGDTLQVRYRQGGETCQLRGRPNKSLKKILQESAVPPWQRERFPLLYCDATLVCIPGIGVAESVALPADGQGIVIEWQAPTWDHGPG